jgi:hypothetical protein
MTKKGACMPKSIPKGLPSLFNGGINGWVAEGAIWPSWLVKGVDWTKIKFEDIFEPK